MSAANLSPSAVLGNPRLWRDLARTVRRRIERVEVDDVVQSTLAEALAAKTLPTAEEEVRRFVFAIARQKIADCYRRRRRELRHVSLEPTHTEPVTLSDMQGWVERNLPTSPGTRQTFDWLVREAEGETLAEIAVADRVSAAMVRQRVSRLRRSLRARWTKELAALSVLAIVAVGCAIVSLRTPAARPERPEIVREGMAPSPEPTTAPERTTAPPPNEQPKPATMLPPKLWPPRARSTPSPSASPPPSSSAPKPTASLVERTFTTLAPDGKTISETSLDVTLPAIDVRSCATQSSPRGVSVVSVIFRPDGSVATARVDGGVAVGRPETKCVERLYSALRTRPFKGSYASADAYFTLVPQEPPSWARPTP